MHKANLDANRWIEWYKAVQGSDISISYKKKRWMYVRAWLSWLIERELITSFPSLYSRRYKFSTSDKEVKPLSVEQVREIVRDCKGILKLHVLLMLDCGMTQLDISDLNQMRIRMGGSHDAEARPVREIRGLYLGSCGTAPRPCSISTSKMVVPTCDRLAQARHG